jgi:hypothetical protein
VDATTAAGLNFSSRHLPLQFLTGVSSRRLARRITANARRGPQLARTI